MSSNSPLGGTAASGASASGMGGQNSQAGSSMQQPGSLVKSASLSQIPSWLSTHNLSRKRYRCPSTGNLHGLEGQEFHDTKWPMPSMFGDENYAYTTCDIKDPRYEHEGCVYSMRLIRLNCDLQIVDLEWRKTFNALQRHEKRRENLPPSASGKAKAELDDNVKKTQKYLLELQQQKDMYAEEFNKIYHRCDGIKGKINTETNLDKLRAEMSRRVLQKFAADHVFWKTPFNAQSKDAKRRSDEFDLGGM